MNTEILSIGRALYAARQERHIKLREVSHDIPVATLNAIERGRMIPSLTTTDAITTGLGLDIGAFDLALLATVHDAEDRSRIVDRLIAHHIPTRIIQRVLRTMMHDPKRSRSQRHQAQWLLARCFNQRGFWRRSTILLEHLLGNPSAPRGAFRLAVLSTLGQGYLHQNRPERALNALLQAVAIKPHGDAWESAMANLGLAWWKLGLYLPAQHQWQAVSLGVTHPLRRAQAYCGLGNIALRNAQWSKAIDHYQSALDLYRDAGGSDTDHLRVLNNLLVCYTQQRDTRRATATIAQAYRHGKSDVGVFGEFLATEAQWAWESGQPERAAALIPQAKEWLGEALVVSWFTVRVLDLQMGQVPLEDFGSRLQELEDRLTAVTDERWAGALRLALVRVAWEAGHVGAAQHELAVLERLWPFMG